jgi:DNA-binding CsgD family transcriptional regulator
MGEKQIAVALGLRPPTVHEYVGAIYRHFRVAGRAELMAYFLRRSPERAAYNTKSAES